MRPPEVEGVEAEVSEVDTDEAPDAPAAEAEAEKVLQKIRLIQVTTDAPEAGAEDEESEPEPAVEDTPADDPDEE